MARKSNRTSSYVNGRPLVPGSNAHMCEMHRGRRSGPRRNRRDQIAYLVRLNGGGLLLGGRVE